MRVSRTGWLTASWLVALVIGGVMIAGRFNLDALYGRNTSGRPAPRRPCCWPCSASSPPCWSGRWPIRWPRGCFLLTRLLIGADVIVILIGVGDLVLHQPGHPTPVTLWTVLAVLAAVVMGLMTDIEGVPGCPAPA